MAEFRKVFYALGFAAMLAGVSSTASAQTVTCTQIATPAPIIREESFAELVGEFALDCTGGTPTPSGQAANPVNITISLSTNITSKLLASATAGNWSEALLLVDDPNSPLHPATPLLACGQAGAPDTANARGLCTILSTGNPDESYNGSNGHPNVFQGRQTLQQNAGNTNSIAFIGVPFDAPGNPVAFCVPNANAVPPVSCAIQPGRTGNRRLRITNIRANSPPVSGGFLFQTVIMEININANNIAVTNSTKTVASVQKGISAPLVNGNGLAQSFVQCVAKLTSSTPQPSVRFREGFPSSFKVKSVEQTQNNGIPLVATSFVYNGTTTTYGSPVRQNISGLIYNTESGFSANPNDQSFSPNPPTGYNFGTTANLNTSIANSTGISAAGIATQGTRIAVTFRDLPNGTTVTSPSVVYLFPAGVSPAVAGTCGGVCTGVAVRTSYVSARGDGAFTPSTATTVTGDMIVYEILYSEAAQIEDLLIPLTVSYNLNSLASDLPEVNKTASVSGGFAPFILATDSANAWGAAAYGGTDVGSVTNTANDTPTVGVLAFFSASYLPVPRFKTQSAFTNLFTITKCSCNLLFPFVTNAASTNGNFDTGIALANTSLTPGANTNPAQRFGFSNTAQDGPVQFWYYQANLTDPPVATQCTNTTATGVCPGTKSVKAGETLLYVLSQGSSAWGLKGAPGFTGYMIAQASFQYCHAFAYISPQGATPLTNGMSVGYLALSLDKANGLSGTVVPISGSTSSTVTLTFTPSLPSRTGQAGEGLEP